MIRLLITDLDDTLYPWVCYFVPAFYAMARKVAEILDLPLDQLLDEYRDTHQRIGDVETRFATLELPSVRERLAGLSPEERMERLLPAFEAYRAVRADRLRMHPEVRDVLRELRSRGARIVGCTESAGENGLMKLRQLEADALFDAIYVAAGKYRLAWPDNPDPKVRLLDLRKPDPQILREVLLAERTLPEDALYVGDSFTKDVCLASAAGVPCVQVRHARDEAEHARMYERLVAISSWTPEEFTYEQDLQAVCAASGLQPAWTVESFSDVLAIAEGRA